jgi:hypothetical protein
MDSPADPPSSGADPSRGGQPGNDQPRYGAPQPQQWGPPQTGGDQAWAGAPRYGGPQPVIAGTGTGRPRVQPGRIWYLAAVLMFLGGVAWVVFGFVSLSGKVDSFARVPLPAGGSVTLNHSGGYVVYYEGAGANSNLIPHFNVRIAAAAPPAAVGSLHSYATSVTYAIGAHQGRAVLTLQVLHPGRFLVEPSGATVVAGGSDLAFGPSIGGSIVGIVLPSIALVFLGVIGGIVLFIIRHARARRARAEGWQA